MCVLWHGEKKTNFLDTHDILEGLTVLEGVVLVIMGALIIIAYEPRSTW